MTSNMTKLQQQLKDEGIKDVEFVSFSVDPEIDKPDVLKKFGDQFNGLRQLALSDRLWTGRNRAVCIG